MNTKEKEAMTASQVPRITGLLLIEVRHSNPNGDPERESSPRQRPDRKGEISPVSIKRKLRDIVEKKDELILDYIKGKVSLPQDFQFDIMESRDRGWDDLKGDDETERANDAWTRTSELISKQAENFKKKYWDARLFGNTFLEKAKEEGGIQDTIRAGVVHFGVGISVAPVEIEFSTWTKMAPAQEDRTRGMAPMAWRVVKHGLYTVPFFVNPTQARKTGCTLADVQVMLHLLKHAYPHTRSVPRAQVDVIYAHVVQHNDPLGSFSDFALLDALAPKRVPDKDKPSEALEPDYEIPTWDNIKDKPVRESKPTKWSEVGSYTDYAM
jgi:Cas7 group CRISPR-associated protein Csh2